jgi:hypothetical protein
MVVEMTTSAARDHASAEYYYQEPIRMARPMHEWRFASSRPSTPYDGHIDLQRNYGFRSPGFDKSEARPFGGHDMSLIFDQRSYRVLGVIANGRASWTRRMASAISTTNRRPPPFQRATDGGGRGEWLEEPRET